MPRWRVDDGGDIAASGLDATMAAPSTAGQSRLSTSDLGAPVDDSGAPARIDRYLLLEELGHGAMGVVYAAYDPQLDRKVAIKRIRGDRGDALGHARMLREAQAMARLSHPNVVHVHDVGTTDGDVFIAMEYIHGSTLRAWLAASNHPLAAVLEIFRAAGRGLAAAHAADLVHRDFKPDNVLVDQSGRPHIADFGLARATAMLRDLPTLEGLENLAGGDDQLTRTGTLLGTPAYMAPEQHLGLPSDARCDQYAFCVALFEALYGQRPYSGATLVELRQRVVLGNLQEPGGARVPRWIFPILARGLDREPARRWPDMGALIDALGRDPQRTRRRWIAGGVAALGLTGAVVGAYSWQAAVLADKLATCRASEAVVTEQWTDERRSVVRERLLATGLSYARRGADQVEQAIDGFFTRWHELHRDACEAAHVRGEVALEILALREACFVRQRQEVFATLDLLVEADATVVDHITDVLSGLPRPEQCGDLRHITEHGAVGDPAVEARAEQIRVGLYRVHAEANAGRYQRGQDLLQPLLAEALELGDRRLVARMRAIAGRLAADLGDHDGAEAHYLAGLTDALATDQAGIAAEIAVHCIYLEGYYRGHTVEARRWAHIAEGLVTRTGDDDLRLQMLNHLGVLHAQASDYPAALAVYDEAIAITRRLDVRAHDNVSLISNRAIILNYLGRRDEAIAAHHRALAMLLEISDENHPDVAHLLSSLGTTLLYAGDVAGARAEYEKALVLQERLLGPKHPLLAYTLSNLATARLESGDPDAALTSATRALELLKASGSEDQLFGGYVHVALGDVLLRLGQLPAAAEHCRRGQDLIARDLGPEHIHVASALLCLGEVHLQRSEPALAMPLLERAVRLHGGGSDIPDADRARARFALARAQAATGDLAAALATADEAMTHYTRAGDQYAERLTAVRTWRVGVER